MELYEEVQAERLATLELRHQLAREGAPAERLLAARMWERYLVRTLRAAQAAGNELVIERGLRRRTPRAGRCVARTRINRGKRKGKRDELRSPPMVTYRRTSMARTEGP